MTKQCQTRDELNPGVIGCSSDQQDTVTLHTAETNQAAAVVSAAEGAPVDCSTADRADGISVPAATTSLTGSAAAAGTAAEAVRDDSAFDNNDIFDQISDEEMMGLKPLVGEHGVLTEQDGIGPVPQEWDKYQRLIARARARALQKHALIEHNEDDLTLLDKIRYLRSQYQNQAETSREEVKEPVQPNEADADAGEKASGGNSNKGAEHFDSLVSQVLSKSASASHHNSGQWLEINTCIPNAAEFSSAPVVENTVYGSTNADVETRAHANGYSSFLADETPSAVGEIPFVDNEEDTRTDSDHGIGGFFRSKKDVINSSISAYDRAVKNHLFASGEPAAAPRFLSEYNPVDPGSWDYQENIVDERVRAAMHPDACPDPQDNSNWSPVEGAVLNKVESSRDAVAEMPDSAAAAEIPDGAAEVPDGAAVSGGVAEGALESDQKVLQAADTELNDDDFFASLPDHVVPDENSYDAAAAMMFLSGTTDAAVAASSEDAAPETADEEEPDAAAPAADAVDNAGWEEGAYGLDEACSVKQAIRSAHVPASAFVHDGPVPHGIEPEEVLAALLRQDQKAAEHKVRGIIGVVGLEDDDSSVSGSGYEAGSDRTVPGRNGEIKIGASSISRYGSDSGTGLVDGAPNQTVHGYQHEGSLPIHGWNGIEWALANDVENSCDTVAAAKEQGAHDSGAAASPLAQHQSYGKPTLASSDHNVSGLGSGSWYEQLRAAAATDPNAFEVVALKSGAETAASAARAEEAHPTDAASATDASGAAGAAGRKGEYASSDIMAALADTAARRSAVMQEQSREQELSGSGGARRTSVADSSGAGADEGKGTEVEFVRKNPFHYRGGYMPCYFLYDNGEDRFLLDESTCRLIGITFMGDWIPHAYVERQITFIDEEQILNVLFDPSAGNNVFSHVRINQGPHAGERLFFTGSVIQRDDTGIALLVSGYFSQIQANFMDSICRIKNHSSSFDIDAYTGEIHFGDSFRSMLGLSQDDRLPATVVELEKTLIHPEDLMVYRRQSDVIYNPALGDYYESIYRIRHKGGYYIWCIDRGLVVERKRNGRASRVIGTTTNIDVVRSNFERLKRSIYQDPLTGLHNRLYLNTRYKYFTMEESQPLTLVYVDISGLKVINDYMGHSNGDELVKIAAKVLLHDVMLDHELVRLSGDEFLLIFPCCSREQCEHFMAEFVEQLGERNKAMEFPLPIYIGYGCATLNEINDGDTFARCEQRADKRLQEYKSLHHEVIYERLRMFIENATGRWVDFTDNRKLEYLEQQEGRARAVRPGETTAAAVAADRIIGSAAGAVSGSELMQVEAGMHSETVMTSLHDVDGINSVHLSEMGRNGCQESSRSVSSSDISMENGHSSMMVPPCSFYGWDNAREKVVMRATQAQSDSSSFSGATITRVQARVSGYSPVDSYHNDESDHKLSRAPDLDCSSLTMAGAISNSKEREQDVFIDPKNTSAAASDQASSSFTLESRHYDQQLSVSDKEREALYQNQERALDVLVPLTRKRPVTRSDK